MAKMKTANIPPARKAMIDSQLRPSGVNAPFVLERMATLAREDFVPEKLRPLAYIDRSLPLGDGRFLPSPLFHGRLLAEAAPTPQDHVLVIENGSAYLAELCRPLVAELESVGAQDAERLARSRKRFSLILIDGAVEHLPDWLLRRLDEGARVVTGLVEDSVTKLASGRKIAGIVALHPIVEMGIPVIHEFDKPKTWQF